MGTIQNYAGIEDGIRERSGSEIVALRRDIHCEPEIGFDTEKTARKVVDALEGLPLEIETGLAENGVVATLRGSDGGSGDGPTVGLRADMDALPIHEQTGLDFASEMDGKMHACGHDGHTSMLVGAAHALCSEELRGRLKGDVKFIFQPAEEGYAGGRVMVEEGVTRGLDQVFALHLWPGLAFGTFSTKGGTIMAAADGFEMQVRGEGGHGAMPHLTADAVMMASYIATTLQTIVSREVDPAEAAVLTIGEIGAGSAFNIIPETARLAGTVRTVSPELRERMPERILEISRGVANGMRGDAELDYRFAYPVTRNDESAARLALEVAGSLFGEDKAVQATHPSMAAEDFAYMLEEVPGAYVWLGVGDVSGLHTPAFAFDEDILPRGAAMLAALALETAG